jgi:ubiquinone/menaquinone biosynthesis C-methylase UbiE
MLPFRRHTEVIAEHARPQGRLVLEVGCGDGRLLQWLVRRGAQPLGIDPDPAQLARARADNSSIRLVQATGERLPLRDVSIEAVIYMNSLHHVPVALQDAAVREAGRVLTVGGDLVVIEPLAEGTWFELLRPLEDETFIRAKAVEALFAASAGIGLTLMTHLVYGSRVEVASLEVAIERLLAANPERAGSVADAREELSARFATNAERAEQGFAFSQPMRLAHFRRPA